VITLPHQLYQHSDAALESGIGFRGSLQPPPRVTDPIFQSHEGSQRDDVPEVRHSAH